MPCFSHAFWSRNGKVFDKVRQILLNLLSNAIKFTDERGNIELNCELRDGLICIRVVDDGSGISNDKLAAIFEPFVQVDREYRSTQHQGTGLGLSISRDLARRMKGDLTVTRRARRFNVGHVELLLRGTTLEVRAVPPTVCSSTCPTRALRDLRVTPCRNLEP